MNISFPEQISESTCLIVFKFLHTTPLGVLVVPYGVLVQNYDLFRRFDAHFVSGADLEKYWPITVILHMGEGGGGYMSSIL